MARHKMVNGVKIDFTDAEEKARDLQEQEVLNGAFDRSMEDLRLKRNMLLNQTDYIVIKAKETGGTISSAW